MEIFFLILIIGAIFGGIGYAVAAPDQKGMAAALGFILGPIGIIIALLAKR